MANHKGGRRLWAVLLPWVEPAVAAAIGILLYFPLQRRDLADIAWILGVLLSFNSVAVTRRLREELDAVHRLAQVVDLTQETRISEVSRILRLYLAIQESEFRSLKNEIIEQCADQLSHLANDKAIVAGGSEYYIWLRDMMRGAGRHEHIRAVSVMAESEWTDIPAEKAYLDENIAAAGRGVRIERVFVTSKIRLSDSSNLQVLRQHLGHANDGLKAYIVWEEDLAARDPSLRKDVGEGFVLFGDRAALIDVTVPPTTASGRITLHQPDLERCRKLFDRIMLFATSADSSHLS